jgi:hypothetical protein
MGLTDQLMLEQLRELKKKALAKYQAWDKTKAISIRYAGAEVTATGEVKANSLELAAPAGVVVETIDLTAAATNTLAEVVAAINALADWECALGGQFDGSEDAAAITVSGAPVDVHTASPVWFAQDTNPQMVITIPAPTATEEITFTGFVGKSTYAGGGTSTIEVYDGATKKWSEPAGASAVIKESFLKRYTMTAGNALKVKVVNSVEMTAGEMSVAYEIKDAQPYSV